MSRDLTVESWGENSPVIESNALARYASEPPAVEAVISAGIVEDDAIGTHHRGLPSRNVVIDGKRTSIRLDDHGYDSLHDIARRERMTVNDLCAIISERNKKNDLTFTAALRIFMLAYYRKAATDEGYKLAGHGLGRPLLGTPFEVPDDVPPEEPPAEPPAESKPSGGRGKVTRSARPQRKGGESLPSGEEILVKVPDVETVLDVVESLGSA